MATEVNDFEAILTLKKQNKMVPKCENTTSDPGSTDDSNAGWDVGDVWVNTSTKTGFECVDNTVGSADWKETTASSGGITVVKSADESLVSSTTMQDDDDLKFALLNTESWAFTFTLVATEAGANPNIKITLAATGGLTGTIEYNWYKFGGSSSGGASDFTTDSSSISLDSMKSLILIVGSVSATADGTLQLKWAQGSSDTDATIVHKHSSLVASKV